MPKASAENTESDPRVARAILSAPYPLPSIRTRPYIIFRPIHPPSGQVPGGQRQFRAVAFVPDAPYFHGLPEGSVPPPTQITPDGTRPLGQGRWPMPIALPSQPLPSVMQTEEQKMRAEQLSEALRSPMDISEVGQGGQGSSPMGPLHVAHEIGRITAQSGVSATPKGPPHSLNLLTSTYQTILPRSLLDFKQMHNALITPPTLTSSTTFYTGVTAGGGNTARPSPTTPVAPPRSGPGISPARSRKYGQREKESSDEGSDDGWSSDATITKKKHRSPMSPILETPSTPRPTQSRHPRPPYRAPQSPPSRPTPGHTKSTRRYERQTSPPLFLGQTNLSPFTYDLSRRRRPPASGSTMSLLGFESDASTVLKVSRSFPKQRERRYGGGGLFYSANKGKGRMGRVEEEELEVARRRPLTSLMRPRPITFDQPTILPVPTAPIPQVQSQVSNQYQAMQPQGPLPASPEQPYSPQPISIDPQSALLPPPTWPNASQQSFSTPPIDNVSPEVSHQRGQLPFTKACHNFLLVRHRQAARRRRLLLDYHRRVKIEAEEEDEKMQVDTPAVQTFAASEEMSGQSVGMAQSGLQYQQQQPYPSQAPIQSYLQPSYVPHHSPVPERHQVAIRNIASIARVELDDGKPARKRRRDISPESFYQPFAAYHPLPGHPIPLQATRSPHVSTYVPPRQTEYLAPQLGAGGSGPTRSSSLLPSFEIHTPPPPPGEHRRASHPSATRTNAVAEASGVRRVSEGYNGQYDFEKERTVEEDRRALEEMKDARRNAWLEDIGERRAGKGNSRRR